MKKLNPFTLFLLVFSIGCNQTVKENNELPKPNILLIVADDLGYSDIGPFGGNITTPAITSLAKEGISFSRFYVNPTCSPTRSSLMTGNDNHIAGFGIMSEMDYPALSEKNLPGYSGKLSKQVVTIPEVLQQHGYHTYMVGKWHLGEGPGHDPYDRGFEETFILGTGGGSHYNDMKALSRLQRVEYTRNGKIVEPEPDFYSTKDYTDSLIAFIDRNKDDAKPFFAFLSYTAVHDPLHTPEDYIERYRGKFDMGYDSLWLTRLKNLQALGIVTQTIPHSAKNPLIPEWDSLSKEQQQVLARDMEVYAGMLEYLDMSIGRVFEYLRESGLYENTMILFMSDNGANGAMATAYPGNEDGEYLSTFDNSLDNRGLKNSYIETGPGWAQASSSPFRFFKGFATEGGIRAPLIIKSAGDPGPASGWNHSFIHVTDIMPTLLEIAGAPYPDRFNGNDIHPHIGKSILPILSGDSVSVHTHDGYGWELFEMKAYIRGNWKLLRLPKPMGTGEWQLFDIIEDPSETRDLSDQFPEIKAQLIMEWTNYALKNEVYDHNGHYDIFYKETFDP